MSSCASLLALTFVLCVPRGETRLSPEELRQDAEILEYALTTLHPGIDRFSSRVEHERRFGALLAELDREQTLSESYLAFSRFLAGIRCGHTFANPVNQGARVTGEVLGRGGRVPFRFRWLGERMVVTRSFADEPALSPGAEVLSIDGVPVPEILARLRVVTSTDGSNEAKRLNRLEVRGAERFETFDVFLPLVLPEVEERLELVLRPADGGAELTCTVAPLRQAEREAQRQPEAEPAPFVLATIEPGIALLRMSTWALYDAGFDWRANLEQVLDDLVACDARALVLDLRGNEGGLAVGDEILARLVAAPLVLSAQREHLVYRAVPDDLRPYLETWDRSFFDWGDAVEETGDGGWRRKESAAPLTIVPRGERFAGELIVLVDSACSSATFSFAQVVQRERLGTLVGTPTGGNQRGITGSAFFFLRLPNSKIEVDVPLIASFPDGDPPDSGLTPDVLVETTLENIRTDHDAVLEAALRLARVATGGARPGAR